MLQEIQRGCKDMAPYLVAPTERPLHAASDDAVWQLAQVLTVLSRLRVEHHRAAECTSGCRAGREGASCSTALH